MQQPQGAAVDELSTQRTPECESSPSRKSLTKVTVTEHIVDNFATPNSGLSPSNLIISKPKHQPITITTTTSLSPTKPRPLRPLQHQSSTQKAPFLTILPHDIHYLLATHYLDFNNLLALRQTCHALHSLFTPALVHRIRSSLVQDSLAREIAQYKDYRAIYPRQRLGHLWDLLYAAFDFRLIERPARELRCYGCLEVKPLWHFVERMSNRGTGLGAKSAKDRMCKDCMRRFRDVEGEWWKENWVKKSDTVRKASRSRRVRRWVCEGGSLINPDQEIGVCASCGSGTFELWWGCVSCFDLEEQKRREEDLIDFEGPLERRLVDFFENWRVKKEAKRRRKLARRDRRSRRWWLPGLGIGFGGNMADRRAALLEWKDSKASQHRAGKPDSNDSFSSSNATPSTTNPHRRETHPWRALDQIPLPKSRREARCSSCWAPNCPRRTYILGLAYERPLPRERWCPGCRGDHERRYERRIERKGWKRERMGEERESGNNVSDRGGRRERGIFSESWEGDLGVLFEER